LLLLFLLLLFIVVVVVAVAAAAAGLLTTVVYSLLFNFLRGTSILFYTRSNAVMNLRVLAPLSKLVRYKIKD
jgi:hypothetical protein